jgi:NhaA family Na+:H+ antiporter
LLGAGALAGIGFTMSLFIAGQAMPTDADFAAAKIAVFGASIASAMLGVLLLWKPLAAPEAEQADAADPASGHSIADG